MGQPQYAQPPSRDERGMMGNLEAMSRKSESLRRFSGNSADFTNWSEHFMDHMSRVHVSWRGVLQYISTCSEDLSLSRLHQDLLGPNQEPANELAMKLEQTIIDWMPESLYKRRAQLCDGKSETGNGFLMWRRLFVDNKGPGEPVEFAGVEALRLYPSCSKLSDVGSHLDGWIELLDAYGSEFLGALSAPRMLRSMMLNILPKELKSEILKDKTLQNAGYIELIDWC